jgi:hypothetical protein
MSCTRGKANPDAHTKLKLFADSGGFCQNPDCNKNLFLVVGDTEFHIAEMAHIISAGNDGPRSDSTILKELKGDFSNLILLCPTCHTKIDKAESEFPESLILTWKKEHSLKIQKLFNIKLFGNRPDARKSILPLLNENRKIFEIYGPLTDERFNPESEMPKLWHRKTLQYILPNNRNILNIIEANYSLLSPGEIEVAELFKQHVFDFESKHLNNEDINGIQFPVELNNIFTD